MKNRNGKNNQQVHPESRFSKDPISALQEEHVRALRYTSILDAAAERIRRDGFSFESYTQISDAIQYIDTEIRVHDKKEENYLFPLLARHEPDPTNSLRYEHRELWSAMSQLRMIVKDVAEGNIHGSSISELVSATKAVADLLRNHITKEDEIIFPLVRTLLSSEEYGQLTKEIGEASVPRR